MGKAMTNAKAVRKQAVALMATCSTVLNGPEAHGIPDCRITSLAMRILDAAKEEAPRDKILASIEIDKGSWPVILSTMHAVIAALDA